jgi:hypothetical protein
MGNVIYFKQNTLSPLICKVIRNNVIEIIHLGNELTQVGARIGIWQQSGVE